MPFKGTGIGLTSLYRRKLPGRSQYEPTAAQPYGQLPLGDLGTASCAPCGRWQYEPTAAQP